ncbi:MAG: hypothetical protein LBV22_02470 [Mycoplasmataceae bacterium]|jgi:hypothetical protein|nr:hypothetical protein [Mycoplasmataceae bacterium]
MAFISNKERVSKTNKILAGINRKLTIIISAGVIAVSAVYILIALIVTSGVDTKNFTGMSGFEKFFNLGIVVGGVSANISTNTYIALALAAASIIATGIIIFLTIITPSPKKASEYTLKLASSAVSGKKSTGKLSDDLKSRTSVEAAAKPAKASKPAAPKAAKKPVAKAKPAAKSSKK